MQMTPAQCLETLYFVPSLWARNLGMALTHGSGCLVRLVKSCETVIRLSAGAACIWRVDRTEDTAPRMVIAFSPWTHQRVVGVFTTWYWWDQAISKRGQGRRQTWCYHSFRGDRCLLPSAPPEMMLCQEEEIETLLLKREEHQCIREQILFFYLTVVGWNPRPCTH